MSQNIESAFRQPIIEIACAYSSIAGANRALVMYMTEGHIPTQIQIRKAGGTSSEDVYATIAIEFLSDFTSNGGSVLSAINVVEAIKVGGDKTATARLTSFAKEVTIPPGANVLGVSLNAGASDYNDSETVWLNIPPRSLTVFKALR